MAVQTDPAETPSAPAFRNRVLLLLAAALFVCAAVATATVMLTMDRGSGSDVIAGIGGPFTLVDQDGRTITDKTFLGKPTAYFFGYTHCPDACPTTLMDMTDRLKALGPDGDKFNIVFVSIDPARDTPELLKTYLESFDPRITAATGTQAQVDAIAKEFRVYYKKVGDGDSYSMDHSTATYMMNARGGLVTLIDYQEPQADALEKMRRALAS